MITIERIYSIEQITNLSELARVEFESDRVASRRHIETSAKVWQIKFGERVSCFAGVHAGSVLSSDATLWLMLTENFRLLDMRAYKREILPALKAMYPGGIATYISDRHHSTIPFAETLGFEIEVPMQFYPQLGLSFAKLRLK